MISFLLTTILLFIVIGLAIRMWPITLALLALGLAFIIIIGAVGVLLIWTSPVVAVVCIGVGMYLLGGFIRQLIVKYPQLNRKLF